MNIYLTLLLFAIGVGLVVKGGDLFVDAASRIAKSMGIPTFIIGATIVSLATTMPEMIVSVLAAAQGKNEMAVGNAVGSVTANVGLIMAVAMVFMPVIASRKKYLPQSLFLIGAAALLWVGSLSGRLAPWAGVMLALLFAASMWVNIQNGKREMAAAEKTERTKKETWRDALLFLLGAAGIVGGSQLLVSSGSDIASFFGVPERVIAVTLVAVGTSLPELVTTITAIRKKESGLSVGNIIGANIIDLSLILPVCSVVSGSALPVAAQSVRLDLPVCLGVCLIAIVPMLIKEKAYKWQGVLLLILYAAYVAVTV